MSLDYTGIMHFFILIIAAFDVKQVWVPGMVASVTKMLDNWEAKVGEMGETEMEVHKEFHELSAEIFSRTVLGNNYENGKRIFKLQQQQEISTNLAMQNVYIPGFR